MASVYITEFAHQGQDFDSRPMSMPREPRVANQVVVIGAGSVQTAASNPSTTFVRVHAGAICSIEFGTNPTAATSTRRMAANSTEYFSVPKGQSFKMAVITNT